MFTAFGLLTFVFQAAEKENIAADKAVKEANDAKEKAENSQKKQDAEAQVERAAKQKRDAEVALKEALEARDKAANEVETILTNRGTYCL